MLKTTLGQLMINDALPEDVRDYDRVLDKRGVDALMQEVAEKHPDQYRQIAKDISDVGRHAAYTTGGHSFGLKHIRQSLAGRKMRLELGQQLQNLYRLDMPDDKKEAEIIRLVGKYQAKLSDEVLAEAEATDNPLARQIKGAGRGNKFGLNSLLGGDLLYTDHKGEIVPIPVLRSYSQGALPHEYFAGAFGTRKGVIDLKMATRDAGFFAKQLVQATHRLLVEGNDDDVEYDESNPRGMIVDTADADNDGALLAHPVAGYPRNTELTPRILKDLQEQGSDQILIRSPIVGGPASGGVYARDVGRRERGGLAPVGDYVGIAAAQALAEPVTQAQICLAAGTPVRMADWSVKLLEKIQPGDFVLGADRTGNTFPVRVIRRYDNGLRDCVSTFFRIPFNRNRAGMTMVSTEAHKVLLLRKVSNCRGEEFNNMPQILPVGTKTGRLRAVLPRGFSGGGRSEPMAPVVGLLLGDGCYTEAVDSCNFSCFDPLLATDHVLTQVFCRLNLKLSKLVGHTGYYKFAMIEDDLTAFRNGSGQVIPGSRNPIRQWLEQRGMWGKYAHEKQLPPDIHEWDNTSVAELLGCYFVTDGSVYLPTDHAHQSKPYFNYGSTSEQLLLGVRDLLAWRFGIYATGPYGTESGGRKRPMYYLNIDTEVGIRRFATAIPLYGVKRERAANLLAAWVIERPREHAVLLREDPVAVGKKPTYDLEVDHDDHLFVLANGLIVSNSSKHTGGIAGAAGAGAISGFKYINQLVQVPKKFRSGAAHSQRDGRVARIEKAPQGGKYVYVGNEEHYVHKDYPLKVAVGDEVEAGDVLSDGIPNPAEIVKHKGLGEGRRYFIDAFRSALEDSGVSGHRRNMELLSRGLLNYVRLTDEIGDWSPDDVVPYQQLERQWRPRAGHTVSTPKSVVGQYLERPVLHYTVGTKIRPSMLGNMDKFGVKNVVVHRDPPPFQAEMIRGMANVAHDPDWMTRMFGSYQTKSLLEGARRGAVADEEGTSYVPALAAGANFGRAGLTKGWDSNVQQPTQGARPPKPPDYEKPARVIDL